MLGVTTKKNEDGSLKKPHVAFFLDKQGYLALDENFYKYTSPSEMVFNALKKTLQKSHCYQLLYYRLL